MTATLYVELKAKSLPTKKVVGKLLLEAISHHFSAASANSCDCCCWFCSVSGSDSPRHAGSSQTAVKIIHPIITQRAGGISKRLRVVEKTQISDPLARAFTAKPPAFGGGTKDAAEAAEVTFIVADPARLSWKLDRK